MKYNRIVKIKDGTDCIVRHLCVEDAEEFIKFRVLTCSETNNMGRYPDEIEKLITPQKQKIYETEISENAITLGAFIDNEIVAHIILSPVGNNEKNKHRAEIGVATIKKYWNKGIGSILLETIIKIAKNIGYEFLELEVVSDNLQAIALYEKFNFKVYGVRPKSFIYRDGSYKSSNLMMLDISNK